MPGVTYSIDFAAQIARLTEGTQKGARAVRDMADQMEHATNFARNAVLGLAAAFGGLSLTEWIKSASESADASAKMADRFGISTQAMIGMQHAAKLAGADQEALTTGLRTMAYQATQASEGLMQSKRAFELLNIDSNDFLKLPMDQQFRTIVDRLHNMHNAALRSAVAQQILGRSAGDLMAIVADGSGSLDEARRKTEAWGLAISRIDAAKLEAANDAMTNAKAAANGAATQIAVALAPAVYGIATAFADAAAKTHGFKSELSAGMETAVDWMANVADAFQSLRFGWKILELGWYGLKNYIIQGLSDIADAISNSKLIHFMEYLPGPIGLAARAFGSLAEANKSALAKMAAETATDVDKIGAEMEKLGLEGNWGDEIRKKWKHVREIIEAEAKRIEESRKNFNKPGGVLPDLGKNDEQVRAELAKRTLQIITQNRTEEEVLKQGLAEKQAMLDMAHSIGLLSEENYQIQVADIYAEYDNARVKMADDAEKKKYGIQNVYHRLSMESAGFFFNQMAGMMSSHNRAAFEIGKASAIAHAIIDTHAAAVGAYKSLVGIPIIGPALATAAAAAAIVAGMAQVQQIRSTQFGGGASGGATAVFAANPVTGVPNQSTITPQSAQIAGPAATPPAPPKQDVNLTFIGQSFTYDQIVNEVIPQINAAAGNGVNIQVSTV